MIERLNKKIGRGEKRGYVRTEGFERVIVKLACPPVAVTVKLVPWSEKWKIKKEK